MTRCASIATRRTADRPCCHSHLGVGSERTPKRVVTVSHNPPHAPRRRPFEPKLSRAPRVGRMQRRLDSTNPRVRSAKPQSRAGRPSRPPFKPARRRAVAVAIARSAVPVRSRETSAEAPEPLIATNIARRCRSIGATRPLQRPAVRHRSVDRVFRCACSTALYALCRAVRHRQPRKASRFAPNVRSVEPESASARRCR
jgi:hypothetical protein